MSLTDARPAGHFCPLGMCTMVAAADCTEGQCAPRDWLGWRPAVAEALFQVERSFTQLVVQGATHALNKRVRTLSEVLRLTANLVGLNTLAGLPALLQPAINGILHADTGLLGQQFDGAQGIPRNLVPLQKDHKQADSPVHKCRVLLSSDAFSTFAREATAAVRPERDRASRGTARQGVARRAGIAANLVEWADQLDSCVEGLNTYDFGNDGSMRRSTAGLEFEYRAMVQKLADAETAFEGMPVTGVAEKLVAARQRLGAMRDSMDVVLGGEEADLEDQAARHVHEMHWGRGKDTKGPYTRNTQQKTVSIFSSELRGDTGLQGHVRAPASWLMSMPHSFVARREPPRPADIVILRDCDSVTPDRDTGDNVELMCERIVSV